MSIRLVTVKRGLLLFWAVWFSLVFLTNVLDGLKEAGALPAAWRYSSGNFRLVVSVGQLQGAAPWLAAVLFGGVIAWEGLCAGLFWRAVGGFRDIRSGRAIAVAPLAASIALWAAFSVAVEAFIAFQKISESVFQTLLAANLLSLVAVCLLPDE